MFGTNKCYLKIGDQVTWGSGSVRATVEHVDRERDTQGAPVTVARISLATAVEVPGGDVFPAGFSVIVPSDMLRVLC